MKTLENKYFKYMNKVKQHYNKAIDLGYEVVGVFLQGSQNYGLDVEGSDVDTKAIVLPKFEDIVLNKKPVSTTHIMDDGSHMDVKDIRLMFNEIKKQNINFVELLFTDYKIINNKYSDYIKVLFEHREEIARYKPIAALKCSTGNATKTFREIEKKFDRKKFTTVLRFEDYMIKYINGCDYITCVTPNDLEYLKGIKSGDIVINEDEAISKAKYAVEHCKLMLDMYEATHTPEINTNVDILFNDVVTNILTKWFKEELN